MQKSMDEAELLVDAAARRPGSPSRYKKGRNRYETRIICRLSFDNPVLRCVIGPVESYKVQEKYLDRFAIMQFPIPPKGLF